MKWVFRIIAIFAWSSQLHAQESCTEKLFHANSLYEKGQINDAIVIAKTCATITNTPAEQWQAYRLLAMAYLANGEQKEARKAAEKMMELNPTYQPSTLKDPVELIRLLESVKIIPKFTMGLAATVGGINTKPRIITTYNGANYTKNYSAKNSWQVGIIMGYNLNEMISIHSGLLATSKKYDINYNVDKQAVSVNEQLIYLDIPLYARFTSRAVKRFSFFADAGAYSGRLMSAQSNFKLVNTSTGETREQNNLNALDRRTNWEYGALTGVGILYKFKPLILAFEARYFLSAYSNNITNTGIRYKNENLYYNYYYIDDDLRLNNLAFSISMFYSINYKVIKKND
jgi:hypothetical protein